MRLWKFLVIYLILNVLTGSYAMPVYSQNTSISVTPNALSVGSDYAFEQRGYFWDFSDSSHYALEMTREHLFDGGSISGGWLNGKVNSTAASIWLLTPSDVGSNITQYEGAYKPINPSHYRYLTMRICMEENNIDGAIVWYTNRSEYGVSSAFLLKSGCQVVSIDLANSYGIGKIKWDSGRLIEGIALTFLKTNTVFSLDYVRLSATDPKSKPPMKINWAPFNGSFSLFFDSELDNSKKTLIASGLDGHSGNYTWDNVPDLAPNKYHFIFELGNTVLNSPSFVVNTPPITSIISPNFTSGPDYATVMTGNPWDMNDPSDIAGTINIKNLRFENGILLGTSTGVNRDPIIILNGPQKFPIDTSSYYYFTYRMRDLQVQDIAGGSVARVFWKHNNTFVVSTTEDIITFDGWKTVTLDLRKAILEPGSQNWSAKTVDQLRFDPNEFNYPRNFEIDDIKITGNDIANDQYAIKYSVSDLNNDTFTKSLSYSTNPIDPNPTPISCINTTSSGTVPTSPYQIYLPLIHNGEPACVWNTSNVPAGMYYIFLTATDGLDTINRTSEAPVEIQH